MQIFKIEENDANQRLDKFLKKLLPLATRGLIYKLNRKGKIKVDKKKKDNEYKLQVWEEVKIFLRDEEFKELREEKKKKESIAVKLDKGGVLYEDRYLMVINKEAGINVHPWDHKTKEVSLIEQIHDYLWDNLNSLTFKPALAHRLDRDTSGAIIIGKQKAVLEKLVKDFKNHKIKKFYHAVVLWKVARDEGIIKKKLLRIENAKDENKVQVSEKGQEAETHYKVIDRLKIKTEEGERDISVLEVELKTGRMHQIRVHLSHIGHPILGDEKYWDKKFNFYLKRNFGIERQQLHSLRLEFFHSGRDKNMTLKARLKKDTSEFLDKIKNS